MPALKTEYKNNLLVNGIAEYKEVVLCYEI